MCWEEVRERGRKRRVNLDWEREREGFFEKRGLSLEEVEKKRKEKVQRDRREREGDPEKGDMEVKIKGWQYNKNKEVKGVRIPGLFKKGMEREQVDESGQVQIGEQNKGGMLLGGGGEKEM